MASVAKRDQNRVPTLLGVSNVDGVTPVAILADPTDHYLFADDASTGTDLSGDVAARDVNRIPALIAVSSADGVTPVPVYADPVTGYILIDSM